MDAFNFLNQNQQQQSDLPASDEEIIKLLCLSGNPENNNASRVMDELVRDLDLSAFTETSTVVVPSAPSGYEYIQGQFVGGNFQGAVHQPTETISYVDFEPSETETIQCHLSGGHLVTNETSVLPTPVQEVNSPAPPSSVATLDTRQAAGGKAQGRKREKKVNLYQRTEPLASPEEEKRRLNAINAKMNRDKRKYEKQELENQVKSLTAENGVLQTENIQLKTKLQLIEGHLKAVCKQFNVTMVILPQ